LIRGLKAHVAVGWTPTVPANLRTRGKLRRALGAERRGGRSGIATGFAEPSLGILAACLLITAGAVLAAKSLLFGRTAAAAEASA